MTGTISSILLPPSGWQNPIPGDGNIQKSPSPSHEITSSVPLHTCFLAKSSAKKNIVCSKVWRDKKKIPFFPLCQMIFLDTWGNELVIEQKAGVVKKMHFFISLYPCYVHFFVKLTGSSFFLSVLFFYSWSLARVDTW